MVLSIKLWFITKLYSFYKYIYICVFFFLFWLFCWMNLWHLSFQTDFADFLDQNKKMWPIRPLYLVTSVLMDQNTHQYWVYNDIEIVNDDLFTSNTQRDATPGPAPGSNNEILPAAAWRSDKPRIFISSFSCLRASGPAHHHSTLTSSFKGEKDVR